MYNIPRYVRNLWPQAAWVPDRSSFSQLKLPQRTDPIVETKTFIINGELIKQINKQINSPRSSESKTRKPLRSQVIDGAQERRHSNPLSSLRRLGCGNLSGLQYRFVGFFFSCIAERARGIVGQLSEISSRARQLLS